MQIRVNTQTPYVITVKRNCRTLLNQTIQSTTKAQKVALISDDKVYELYGKEIEAQLKQDFSVVSFVFPQGEHSKTLDTLGDILEFLAEEALDRNDCLIALGGGVVGDITGLAAALYLRGIDYVALPTTLLAQVDSSVGGKTAVDLKGGKNLAGAFYQPKAVLCDMDFLSTLSEEDFACGMAEVVKYALGFDKDLYEILLRNNPADLETIIAKSIEIKRDIVQADERDTNVRQKLNLGHTFGHSVEKCSDFSLKHGQSVAIGLSMICRLFQPALAEEVDELLKMYHLPIRCTFSWQELYEKILLDKKKRGNTIAVIVPTQIGHCEIKEIPTDTLQKLVREVCEI